MLHDYDVLRILIPGYSFPFAYPNPLLSANVLGFGVEGYGELAEL